MLNKKHRNVVSNEVKVAFLCVKLHRGAAYVARQIHRAGAPGYRRETHKDWRLYFWIGEKICAGHVLHGLIRLKISVRTRAPRVHDAFRNTLVVKMRDFFTQK